MATALTPDPAPSTPQRPDPDEEFASRFYRGNAATQTPPDTATPADTPPPPADTTREHAARLLYGDVFLTTAFDQRAPELFDVLGADAAQRAALRQDAIEIGRVVPEAVAVKIVNLAIDGELAAARAEDKAGHVAAVNQRIEASNVELRSVFRQKYGAADGEAMLERVRRFARSSPVLSRALQSHGIGSNPDVVTGIADFVFSSGWRG
jgi:hypothetical protein